MEKKLLFSPRLLSSGVCCLSSPRTNLVWMYGTDKSLSSDDCIQYYTTTIAATYSAKNKEIEANLGGGLFTAALPLPALSTPRSSTF